MTELDKRSWFAGMALQSLIRTRGFSPTPDTPKENYGMLATHAWKLADAMIEVAGQPPGDEGS